MLHSKIVIYVYVALEIPLYAEIKDETWFVCKMIIASLTKLTPLNGIFGIAKKLESENISAYLILKFF